MRNKKIALVGVDSLYNKKLMNIEKMEKKNENKFAKYFFIFVASALQVICIYTYFFDPTTMKNRHAISTNNNLVCYVNHFHNMCVYQGNGTRLSL